MQSQRQTEFIPPRWDDDSAYEGAQGWSYRRWAWEFLRRNAEYQAACKGASRLRGADHTVEGAKFGRVDLRPFWRPYDPADDGRALWLAENVEVVRNLEWDWDWDEPLKPLREGQVALVFDLTQTATAGTGALAAMQARADVLLRRALKEFDRSTKDVAAKPRQCKPAAKSLLEKYLRLYDAIDIFGAPRDATVSVLYPQYWDRRNQTVAEGARLDAHKIISKNLIRARDMVSREYQTLVPLDVARADKERGRSKE